MTTSRSNGVIYVTSDASEKFINKNMAFMAMQMIQLYLFEQGYLVTTSMNSGTNKIELTCHFDGKPFPTLPKGYLYTQRELTSHHYWSDYSKSYDRVRCCTFYFRF